MSIPLVLLSNVFVLIIQRRDRMDLIAKLDQCSYEEWIADRRANATGLELKELIVKDIKEILHSARISIPLIWEYKAANGEELRNLSHSLRKIVVRIWMIYREFVKEDSDTRYLLVHCESERISFCAALCSIFNFIDTLPNPDKLSQVYYSYNECKTEIVRMYMGQDKIGLLLINPGTKELSTSLAAIFSLSCSCVDALYSRVRHIVGTGEKLKQNSSVKNLEFVEV